MQPTHYHLELVRWMAPVHPVNLPDQTFYMIGVLLDKEQTLVISEELTGRSHFYCQRHRFAYLAGAECELCQAEPAEPAETGPVSEPEASVRTF